MTYLRWILALVTSVIVALAGCSSDSNQGDPKRGQVKQALISNQERILGLEDPADYSVAPADAASLLQVPSLTQGSGAVRLAHPNQGWSSVCSDPMGNLGEVTSGTVSIDYLLEQETPWYGILRLVLAFDMAGYEWVDLGEISIQGKAPGVVHTNTWSLTAAATPLAQSYSSVKVCILLGGTAGGYVFDDIDFGFPSDTTGAGGATSTEGSDSTTDGGGTQNSDGTGGDTSSDTDGSDSTSSATSGDSDGSGGTAGSGGSGGSGGAVDSCQPETSGWDKLTLRLPEGLDWKKVPLSAQGRNLEVHDRVIVIDGSTGNPARITALAGAGDTFFTDIGAYSQTGSVVSGNRVSQRSGSTVHGYIKTAGTYSPQSDVVVRDGAFAEISIEPIVEWEIPYQFPEQFASEPSIIQNGSNYSLDPGSYGHVSVQANSRLELTGSAGSSYYYFTGGLRIEPGSVLAVDNASGPVFVFISGEYVQRSPIEYTQPAAYNVLIGVVGEGPIALDGPQQAILVAPQADIVLPTVTAPARHKGSFHGRSAVVHQDSLVEAHGFERDDCAVADDGSGSAFGCEPLDSDGDGVSDCEELGDPMRDPDEFNGLQWAVYKVNEWCGCNALACTEEELDGCEEDSRDPEIVEQRGTDLVPVLGPERISSGWDVFNALGTACSFSSRLAPYPTNCQSEDDGPDDYVVIFRGSARTTPGTHCFQLTGAGVWLLGATSAVNTALTAADGVQCVETTTPDLPLVGVRIPRADPFSSSLGYCESTAQGYVCVRVGDRLPLQPPCEEGECDERCPCDSGSECDDDGDCDDGLVCGQGNGEALGKAPGTSVCWDLTCETEERLNRCGTLSADCGYCGALGCANDADCPFAFSCGYGNGRYFGLSSDVRVCWPSLCEGTRDVSCGLDSACGTCAPVAFEECEPECANATCGSLASNGCGSICRSCEAGQPGCEADSECPEGFVCGVDNGDAFGFPGENVCWRANCLDDDAPCGEGTECGECPECEPQCNEVAPCGDDGCNGSCGECGEALECVEGSCSDTSGTSRSLPEDVDPSDYETQDYTARKVGSMRGSYVVTHDGQVAYSVPLRLPPAPGGLEPRLSLEYHSLRGNGLVGVGWAIAGLSEITRCEKTLSLDGEAVPLQFDDSDPFCVDGRRLVEVQGEYAHDGTVYRTEFDDATKLVSHRPVDTIETPFTFQAFSKDGLIRTYGDNNQRVQQPTSGVYTRWMLNRVEDRHGNLIDFYYDDLYAQVSSRGALQSRKPILIRYGGPNAPFETSTSIAFRYEDREDKRSHYDRYIWNVEDERLRAIDVFQFQRMVKQYKLHYAIRAEGRPSLLSAIEECVLQTPDAKAADGLVCSEPMHFDYEHESDGFAPPEQLGLHPVDAIYLQDPNRYAWTPSEIVLDFDGDGVDDIAMQVFNDSTGWEGRRWQFLKGGIDAIDTPFNAPGGAYLYGHLSTALDIDADGRDELLMEGLQNPDETYRYLDFEGGEFHLVDTGISAHNYEFQSSFTYVVDVDGDGLKDIVRCDERDRGQTRYWRVVHVPDLTVQAVDFETVGCFRQYAAIDVNMDGREELVTTGEQLDEDEQFVDRALVAISFEGVGQEGSSNVSAESQVIKTSLSDLITNYIPFKEWEGHYLVTLDANGDGLADLVTFDGQDINAYINTGSRTSGLPFFEHEERVNDSFATPKLPSGAGFTLGPVLDVNADGRQDIMVYSNSAADPNWFALVATNEDLFQPAAFSGFNIVELPQFPAFGPSNRPIAMDYNGDGVRDFVQKNTPGLGPDYFVGYRQRTQPNPKMSRAQDGYGKVVQFDYETLSNPVVYDADDGRDTGSCEYPTLCRTPRFMVVKEHRDYMKDDSAGESFRSFVHSYGRARFGLKGRGWLGFGVHVVLEPEREASTTTLFDNSFRTPSGAYPFVGLPRSITSEVYAGDRYFRREITNTLLTKQNPEDSRAFFPYLSETTSVSREEHVLRGVIDTETVRTEYTVDEYNNLTRIEQDWSQTPNAGNERHITSFTYKHQEDESFVDSWLIALPSEREDFSIGPPNSDTPGTTRVVEYDYFDHGGIKQITLAPEIATLRSETHFTYDAKGNAEQVTEIGPAHGEQATRTTTIQYDDRGAFPKFVTDPEGYLTEFEFDAVLGLPARVILRGSGAQHLEQLFISDGFGRLRFARSPSGVETRITYDPIQTVDSYTATRVTDGEGAVSIDHDPQGRPVRTRVIGFEGEELSQVTRYHLYGGIFDVTRATTAGGPDERYTYSYDVLGRRTELEHPDGSVTEVCHDGRVTCVKDVNARTRCSKRDVRNRVVLVTEPVFLTAGSCEDYAASISAATATPGIGYQYGPFNALERIRDPSGNITRMTYDSLGQLSSRSDPGTGAEIIGYNGFGEPELSERRISDVALPGPTVEFEYDSLGRPVARTDADGETVWTWDPDRPGLLVSSTSPSGVTRTFDYDELLLLGGQSVQLAGETQQAATQTVTERDEHGRARVVTIAGSGGGDLRLRYGYDDASGILQSVADDTTGLVYWELEETDEFGAPKTEVLGQTWETTLGYEPGTGAIASITTAATTDGSVVQDLAFDHDPVGNLKERTDNRTDSTTAFEYDEYERLAQRWFPVAGGAIVFQDYDYDELGNLTLLPGSGSLEYEHEGKPHAVSRLVSSDGTQEYDYDDFGRLLTRSGDLAPGVSIDIYSAFDLPLQLTLEETGMSYELKYDAFQNRVSSESSTERTVFGPDYYRTEDADGENQVHFFMISNGSRPVAQLIRRVTETGPEDRIVYLHRDHLGSVDTITSGADDGASMLERRTFGPFGSVTTDSEDPDGSILGFTGHLQDLGGLVDMGGRIYDPLVGRFTTPDPIISDPTNSQDYNRYGYVRNNPLSLTDPTGLCACDNLSPSCWCYTGGTNEQVATHDETVAAYQPALVLPDLTISYYDPGGPVQLLFFMVTPYVEPSFAASQYSSELPRQQRFGLNLGSSNCVVGAAYCPGLESTLLASSRLDFGLDSFRRAGAEFIFGDALTLLDPNASSAAKSIAVVMIVATVASGGAVKVLRALPALRAARGGTAAFEIAEGAAQGVGFGSFRAFKSALGRAGPNMAWHHIVEQTPGNLTRFAPEAIHNTGNLIRLDAGIHRQISGFYSSIQPFTGGVTVRSWLSTQPFELQQEFGQDVLIRFGVGF